MLFVFLLYIVTITNQSLDYYIYFDWQARLLIIYPFPSILAIGLLTCILASMIRWRQWRYLMLLSVVTPCMIFHIHFTCFYHFSGLILISVFWHSVGPNVLLIHGQQQHLPLRSFCRPTPSTHWKWLNILLVHSFCELKGNAHFFSKTLLECTHVQWLTYLSTIFVYISRDHELERSWCLSASDKNMNKKYIIRLVVSEGP